MISKRYVSEVTDHPEHGTKTASYCLTNSDSFITYPEDSVADPPQGGLLEGSGTSIGTCGPGPSLYSPSFHLLRSSQERDDQGHLLPWQKYDEASGLSKQTRILHYIFCKIHYCDHGKRWDPGPILHPCSERKRSWNPMDTPHPCENGQMGGFQRIRSKETENQVLEEHLRMLL